MELFDKVTEAAAFLNARGFQKVDIGIVLGSGLGKLAEKIENPIVIDYTDIPHFSASTVESHKGKFIFAKENSFLRFVVLQILQFFNFIQYLYQRE